LSGHFGEAVCETRAGTAIELKIFRMDTKCNLSEEFDRVAGCLVWNRH